MAINFMLKLVANGTNVTGESSDDKYMGWIEVVAYEFGGDRAGVGQAGSGRCGAVNMGNVILRKRADCASPVLFRSFTTNEICNAELVLRKSGGEMEDYMHLYFENASIVKFLQGNLTFGGESPEEEIHLSYQKIRIVYNVQDSRSGIVRGGIETDFEIMGG